MSILNFCNTLRETRSQAISSTVGASATMTIYSGTQPAGPDTALSGNTALVAIPLSTSSFGTSTSAILTASGLPLSANATASGTASFARVTTSGGVAILDLDVGTSGTDIILATTTISAGVTVTITNFTITEG